jgi:8-oxo-dGTP pyrophosphatase MutT (NUDIX family)
MMSRWYPHSTVAAIVEDQGRFLVVEEKSEAGDVVINQPAGHIEDGESIVDAVVRETLEETRFEIEPLGLVGVYRWVHPDGHTYLRFTISGKVVAERGELKLDPAILRPLWLSADDIRRHHTPRSPLVLGNIEDYMKGPQYPLNLLRNIE